jgi:cytochrome P450
MSHIAEEYLKPENVPDALYVPENIWGAWGSHPQEELKKFLGGRDIIFLKDHYHAGHSSKGTWLVASAEANRDVLLDTDAFTSAGVKVFSRLLGGDLLFFPVEVDPPEHAKYRGLLNPYFKPTSIKAMAEMITRRVDHMLDEIIPQGGCEFVRAFAKAFPASIFLDLMGLPRDRSEEFLGWANVVTGASSAQDKRAAMQNIGDYLMAEVVSCQGRPRDGLLSVVINNEVDGRPVTVEEATGCAVVLFLGGLDTVANQLAWTFRQLALDAEMQAQLRAEPERISRANEEMLRFFSAVFLTREATRDVDVAGVTIKAGDNVACCLPTASRDDREFAEPDVLDVDQPARRYLTFGYGPHTCLGMHLAKQELNIVVERWMARVPPFRVAPGYAAASTIGSVISLNSLPLEW